MHIKKIVSLLLSVLLLFSFSANAQYSADTNVVAKKIIHTVSPGLEYSSSVEIFNGARQEIYTFEYSPDGSTMIVPAYGQYIYGFNSVGSLISSYDGEGRVVGGINTDFFITSTGIPLSCLVSDKEVISTCENRAAIGFDESGNAIIGYPKINAVIYSDEKELPVAHINKVPAVWGMYLVTDKFYSTTKSSLESIEIVFRPFEKDDSSGDSFENELENQDEISNEAQDDEISESEDTSLEENQQQETPEADAMLSDASSDEIEEDNIVKNDIEAESDESENDIKENILDNYTFTSQNAEIGTEIDVVITDIFDGVTNSEIPEDSFVLCVPKEQFGKNVEGLEIGDEFKFKITTSEEFSNCVSIFGAGSIILNDGEFVTQSNDSIFYTKNPRTAAGIRPDGSVVFICIDGRSKNSEGVTIRELSDYLKDAGCTYAVNFDGGGSTTFYAADIGEANAKLKNSPSGGVERRVADGMLFVNTALPTGDAEYAAIYPDEYFVYHRDAEQIIDGKIAFADENYYPLVFDEAKISISVDENFGIIENGVFIPNGNTGRAEIFATLDNGIDIRDFKVGHLNITDRVDKINLTAERTFLSPFEVGTNISIEAFLSTIPVSITPFSADWSIQIEFEDEYGEISYKDVGSEYAILDIEKMFFVPLVKGEKYIITAKIGNCTQSLEIITDSFPYADMRGHWASETSYEMFAKEFITGEINELQIRNFAPDRYMTRAEFCVVLARVLGLEIPEATLNNAESAQNADLIIENSTQIFDEIQEDTKITEDAVISNFNDAPEWSRAYVTALYEIGIIDCLVTASEDGGLLLNADEFITRNDVILVLGALINVDADTQLCDNYADFVASSEEDKVLFAKIISSGIINGYEDGTIRQNSFLTRAEAATVFSRFYNVIENADLAE